MAKDIDTWRGSGWFIGRMFSRRKRPRDEEKGDNGSEVSRDEGLADAVRGYETLSGATVGEERGLTAIDGIRGNIEGLVDEAGGGEMTDSGVRGLTVGGSRVVGGSDGGIENSGSGMEGTDSLRIGGGNDDGDTEGLGNVLSGGVEEIDDFAALWDALFPDSEDQGLGSDGGRYVAVLNSDLNIEVDGAGAPDVHDGGSISDATEEVPCSGLGTYIGTSVVTDATEEGPSTGGASSLVFRGFGDLN